MATIKPVPMRQQFAGLFGGDTVGDVRSMMEAERQARIRQAGVDARGGGFLPSLVARARQRGIESLRGGIRSGFDLAGAGDMITEDPRLAKARKRETDKNEIIAELNKFVDDDGIISPQEMQQGYALLMQRGYPEEARKFLEDAKKIADIDRLRAAAAKDRGSGTADIVTKTSEGIPVKDVTTGKRYKKLTLVFRSGKTKTVVLNSLGQPLPPEELAQIDIENLVPTDKKGMGQQDRIEEASEKAGNELFVKEQDDARRQLPNTIEAVTNAKKGLELLPTIETGGVSAAIKKITDFFGVTDENRGQFTNLMAQTIISKIRLFGANPTEGERRYVEAAEAGINQGKKVNKAILQNLVKVLQSRIKRAKYLLNTGTTRKSWQSYLEKEAGVVSNENEGLINSWKNPIKIPASISVTDIAAIRQYLIDNNVKKGYYWVHPADGKVRQRR